VAYNVLDANLLTDVTTEKSELLKVPQWEHSSDYEVMKASENSLSYDLESGTGLPTATFDGGAA
jgi:hypothetical protein